MTRVNLVPVTELHRLHLIAEYREIPRIFSLAREGVAIPERYVLGEGHMRFFYNKLLFLTIRHRLLVLEMERRGYRPTSRDLMNLLLAAPSSLRNNYLPSQEDVDLSRSRILSKLPGTPR